MTKNGRSSRCSDATLEGEAPSKAAKTTSVEPASLVSEGKMRAEVQALLVGADLKTITIGQIRGQLEKRLGLSDGSLTSTKRLRKELCWYLQHEIMKKNQRGADCERIVKALVEFEEYPSYARQMLIESLPHAVSHDDSGPHEHQVRQLGIVRDAIEGSKRSVEAKHAASAATMREAEEEFKAAHRVVEVASDAETAARNAAEAVALGLRSAEHEVCIANDELARAEVLRSSTLNDVAGLRKKSIMFNAVVNGTLDILLEGTWRDEKTRDSAIEAVQIALKDLGVESAMLDAVPIAFARRPADRGVFDVMTTQSVKKTLCDRLSELEAQLAQKNEASAASGALAASALLAAARDRAKEIQGDLDSATAAQEAAAMVLRRAEAEVVSRRAVVDTCRGEHELAERRLQELDVTLAVVDRLISCPKEGKERFEGEEALHTNPEVQDDSSEAKDSEAVSVPGLEEEPKDPPVEEIMPAAPASGDCDGGGDSGDNSAASLTAPAAGTPKDVAASTELAADTPMNIGEARSEPCPPGTPLRRSAGARRMSDTGIRNSGGAVIASPGSICSPVMTPNVADKLTAVAAAAPPWALA
mmetsp:Transcript_101748/g.286935  ORF Transcript_101748/g.286935 Transcript_101748/m.286935 type:complete len:588 (-) Transcript_101748:229-1992(-)